MADEEKDPTSNEHEEAPSTDETVEAPETAAPDRSDDAVKNMDRVLDIKLELVVKIGTLDMKFKDVLDLFPGSVLEIDQNADGPLDLVIGNKKLAEGEVVTVGENLGLRIIKR